VNAEIVALVVSPAHAYEGRPGDGPRSAPVSGGPVEVRAGMGLVGDRYFNHPAHRDAAVTVFDADSLPPGSDVLATRRNIVLRGFPVDSLPRGAVFTLDGIRFEVHRPASPCAWMDVVLWPGAFRELRGHGGKRCVPLDSGVLRLGPVTAEVVAYADA
jgi:MOSC domain-containing protein YiiM